MTLLRESFRLAGINDTALTPAAARELARQLYVLARRVIDEQGVAQSSISEVRHHA